MKGRTQLLSNNWVTNALETVSNNWVPSGSFVSDWMAQSESERAGKRENSSQRNSYGD
jgi:hypothetical protein